MTHFDAKAVRLTGGMTISAPVDEVFPLFSPLGEKLWISDWNPELLHPPGVSWAEGLVFRTREESGEAVWVVAHLDSATHEVEYYRLEPGHYVARIVVRCSAVGEQGTKVSTLYEFTGLSEAGNAEIDAMTSDAYAEKMARWSRWIHDYLAGRASSKSSTKV